MVDVRYLLLLIAAGIAGQTIVPILDDFGPLYSPAFFYLCILLIFLYRSIGFGSDEEE